ncbi:MAG: hypothetical protein AABZ10_12465 [Nitrospirota bacterium]
MKIKFIVGVLMLAVAGSFLTGCPGGGGGASPTSGSLIWEQTNNPSASYDDPSAIAIDTSSLYVVGWDYSPGSTDSQWRIEKRWK